MAFTVGINKQIGYKAESTSWGTLAGAASGKLLRRVTASFNLTKETYQSGEIRTDYQVADFRHGVRSADGSLSGELSPGSYADFFAAAVAKDFAAGVASSAHAVTVAVDGAAPKYTLTRASGSYLTDGFKIGDVIALTVAANNAGDVGKNLVVTGVTALIMNVTVLMPGGTLTTGTTGATCVPAVRGKKTWAPTSGHLDKSFTIEEWYSDILQSEVYTGMKVNTASISMPATGLVTCDFGFMGKDLTQTGTSQYFTSPTAQLTTGVTAAVNGLLMVNGVSVGLLTGINLNINRNMQNAVVVGSNSIQELFEGRIVVEGDFSAYFENATLRDLFKDETEASLIVILSTSNAATADFVSFVLPRIKVNTNTRDDGEQGIVAQHSFTALLNSSGGTGVATEKTTISIQDSQA